MQGAAQLMFGHVGIMQATQRLVVQQSRLDGSMQAAQPLVGHVGDAADPARCMRMMQCRPLFRLNTVVLCLQLPELHV
jgi:hypothetical protein